MGISMNLGQRWQIGKRPTSSQSFSPSSSSLLNNGVTGGGRIGFGPMPTRANNVVEANVGAVDSGNSAWNDNMVNRKMQQSEDIANAQAQRMGVVRKPMNDMQRALTMTHASANAITEQKEATQMGLDKQNAANTQAREENFRSQQYFDSRMDTLRNHRKQERAYADSRADRAEAMSSRSNGLGPPSGAIKLGGRDGVVKGKSGAEKRADANKRKLAKWGREDAQAKSGNFKFGLGYDDKNRMINSYNSRSGSNVANVSMGTGLSSSLRNRLDREETARANLDWGINYTSDGGLKNEFAYRGGFNYE